VNSKPNHVFYGWWVVAASAVGLFWSVPIAVYSFSVFFKPLMAEFHAGRAAVSLGFTLQLLIGALIAPIAGWLIDRWGARRVILVSTVIFGATLLANRAFSASIWQFYVFYLVLGAALQGAGPIPYGNVVAHWFDRHRGLALGLTMLGLGLGAMLMPSFAQRLIARFGWHNAYSILGALVLLVSLPVIAAFLKGRPQELGFLPDGAPQKNSTTGGHGHAVLPGMSAQEAWSSATFWILSCAFFLVSATTQGCVVHMAAMLSDRGITAQTAALGSSVVGAAILVGRVGTGYMLDRLFAPRIAAALFGVSALGIALLLLGTASVAFAGAFLVGLGLGAEVDIIPFLTSRYFGLRAFGKIYSWIFAAFILAGAVGPLIMGAGFDKTGSYRSPLIAFFLATLIAAVLMTRMGPYRFRAQQALERQDILPTSVAEETAGA
jgi:MFS family permease